MLIKQIDFEVNCERYLNELTIIYIIKNSKYINNIINIVTQSVNILNIKFIFVNS